MKTELRFTNLFNLGDRKRVEYIYPWLDKRYKSSSYKTKYSYYHWDDKKKLYKDIKYIENCYSKILKILVKKLNEQHRINLSIRSWKIILGPWLWWFLDTVFERYQSLKCHLRKNPKKDYYAFFFKKKEKLFPKSVEKMSNFYFDEFWTHQIFFKITKYFFSNRINIHLSKTSDFKVNKFILDHEKFYKKSSSSLINIIKPLSRNQKYLVCRGTFDIKKEIELNYKLRSIPNLEIPTNFTLTDKIDNNLRLNLFSDIKNLNDKFEKFIFHIIGEEIPTTFLENFKKLYSEVDNLNLPKCPKIIFGTTHLYFFTMMMFYTAKRIEENKSKLFYFQHGTENGFSLKNFNEDHEIDVADKYFTWGWKKNISKVKPFAITKNIRVYKKNDFKKNKKILFILRTSGLFFRSGSSLIGYKDWKNYLSDTMKFPKLLNKSNLNNLIVRFRKEKDNWNEKINWQKKWKNINFDYGKKPITKTIKQSKIIICSYNSTVFLECMAANFPVLMFMPKKSYELRNDAKKHFNVLYKNKIVFDKINLLAKHLNKIDSNISLWWLSKNIQKIRENFCKNYANTNSDLNNITKYII